MKQIKNKYKKERNKRNNNFCFLNKGIELNPIS